VNAQDQFDPDRGAAEDAGGQVQGIANTIGDVSERVVRLVQEEIELAKAEVSEKLSSLLKGTAVAAAAGFFIVGALQLILIGLALLAYYYLPDEGEVFWGFFVVAGGLILLAVLAGGLAARAVRRGSPPVPSMAMDEARKIRESVSSGPSTPAGTAAAGAAAPAEGYYGYGVPGGSPAPPAGVSQGIPGWDPLPSSGPMMGAPAIDQEPARGPESGN
jgi:uncharacterized membrane protein YqjE